MPVSLTQIASNTASVTFQAGATPDETATIVYYPGHVTENTFAVLNSFQNGATPDEVIAGFKTFNEELAKLIKSWDVYEDEAQTVMFPIDATRFGDLPLSFRMQVFTKVSSDVHPEAIVPQIAS